jgi:hypothetical protein
MPLTNVSLWIKTSIDNIREPYPILGYSNITYQEGPVNGKHKHNICATKTKRMENIYARRLFLSLAQGDHLGE